MSGRQAQVLAALRSRTEPSMIGDLADELGVHPNTVRHHLRALVAAGHVEELRADAAHGRGRPAVRYRATAGTDSPDDLLAALAAEVSTLDAARELALRAGARWAAGQRRGADAIRLMKEQGFDPAHVAEGIVLRACPLAAAAAAAPEVVCTVHLGLLRTLLPDRDVDLRPGGHPQGCLLTA